MKDSRREFLKKAALFAGGSSLWAGFPPSIQKAMAINPAPGSTFQDAEQVVILMQENRSFDHCFGKLKGVRGFNDPRAIHLPNGNLVWLQSDKESNTYTPFRMDIKETKATWMRDIPHSWENQVDARNDGKYDGWIEAKRSGRKEFEHVPLTMGFYEREDIPFYYALADAFTVCDQHFCASLTGTTTNRNYLWAGKTHGEKGDKPKVRNSDIRYNKEVNWRTFPELLQDNGISWKVYQNEVSVGTELEGEDESLLANFTDNNLEWFTQFRIRHSPGHYRFVKANYTRQMQELAELRAKVEKNKEDTGLLESLEKKMEALQSVEAYLEKWSPDNFEKLTQKEKELHQRAFTINTGDPDYHKTETLSYKENNQKREVKIPKGDILHQFRKDVENGELPRVSWLVAPQKFSDHPSAPWYGAWYVSEVLDILTQNPELWKKTIFILNYDENDGYFDHVPPFVPPKPGDPGSGKSSIGLDATGEYVTLQQELDTPGMDPKNARESPVGLGYRVPLVVASPWSRGGYVNSEVFDITSSIMFLEKWLSKKTGKPIKETNISEWRRGISGDLTSVFRPYNGEKMDLPAFVQKEEHVKSIYNASFKDLPENFQPLNTEAIRQTNLNPAQSPFLPKQEPGTKPSNALAYQLEVHGGMKNTGNQAEIRFHASTEWFGNKALGAPFQVYAANLISEQGTFSFAVKAGDVLAYQWPLETFPEGLYDLEVYGPNGFFRTFRGKSFSPELEIQLTYARKRIAAEKAHINLQFRNHGKTSLNCMVQDNAYGMGGKKLTLKGREEKSLSIDLGNSHNWYDLSVRIEENKHFLQRFAGRVETGYPSKTDPYMGRELASILELKV
ncbi:phosphocholine-specific phospholipase C [Pleomorphovibrio marinus]|uniref:phosphocholine-specific phospholipase C n=1 Tax=Pleomorphovibrio marinus TaxID=2164132 RepID=UPI000E0A7F82|nr:phospholipase C, phosphocholine-specific [Pleomorphovibrio marinus]